MKAAAPLVSVWMSAYNSEGTVRRAIESIISQEWADWELLCVNDGSRDDTGAIIDHYAQNDPRIIAVHQENIGQLNSKLKCLELARGKWFVQCDADDWMDPSLLRTSLGHAEQNNVDAIASDILHQKSDSLDFVSFYEGHDLSVGEIYSGHEAFEKSLAWHIPIGGGTLWRDWVAKHPSVSQSPQALIDIEYRTRIQALLCSRIVLGGGKYFYTYSPSSRSRAPSLNLLRKLRSANALVQLCLNRQLPTSTIEAALSVQRAFIVNSHELLLSYPDLGPREEMDAAFAEIRNSLYDWQRDLWLVKVNKQAVAFEIARCKLKLLFQQSGALLKRQS